MRRVWFGWLALMAAAGMAPAAEVLVWHDEFEGEALDGAKWTAEQGLVRNDRAAQLYRADPANLTVADGVLRLTATFDAAGYPNPFYGKFLRQERLGGLAELHQVQALRLGVGELLRQVLHALWAGGGSGALQRRLGGVAGHLDTGHDADPAGGSQRPRGLLAVRLHRPVAAVRRPRC